MYPPSRELNFYEEKKNHSLFSNRASIHSYGPGPSNIINAEKISIRRERNKVQNFTPFKLFEQSQN